MTTRLAAPTALLFLLLAVPAMAWGDEPNEFDSGEDGTELRVRRSSDEPFPHRGDEPGLKGRVALAPASESGWGKWWYRLELGFGWASLMDDPDLDEGYGGGAYFTFGFHRRWGAELGIYFGSNDYNQELGEIGSAFMAGAITMGPVFHVLDPAGRLNLTLELGIGWYVIVPPPILQDESWTLGIYGGATLSFKVFSWVGVGVKLRYNLFNMGVVSGDELRDIKALKPMGVVDRFELPIFLAFYF